MLTITILLDDKGDRIRVTCKKLPPEGDMAPCRVCWDCHKTTQKPEFRLQTDKLSKQFWSWKCRHCNTWWED